MEPPRPPQFSLAKSLERVTLAEMNMDMLSSQSASLSSMKGATLGSPP